MMQLRTLSSGAIDWPPPLVAADVAPAAQRAEKFPTRPVRLIVPYAPGGATDIVARQLAQRLSEYWGYQVVVDNRAGGSGTIALETVARATPDGYTLMVGNVSTNAIAETTFAKTLSIKPSRDLAAVTNLIEIPHLFMVNPTVPVSSLKQFAEYAKTAPRMAYALRRASPPTHTSTRHGWSRRWASR